MKEILKSRLLIAFFIISIIHIVAILLKSDTISAISKCLIVPMLMLYVISERKGFSGKIKLVIVALFFCWAGDILLLYASTNENFFLYGLAAFLLGHLFYIVSFIKFVRIQSNGKALALLFYLLPLSYAILLLAMLYPQLGDMMIPVFVYGIVISIMCGVAMWRWHKTDEASFSYVIMGAILFIISDSIIAINKFHTAFEWSGLLIMATYIIAQYLITVGLMKHLNAEVNT